MKEEIKEEYNFWATMSVILAIDRLKNEEFKMLDKSFIDDDELNTEKATKRINEDIEKFGNASPDFQDELRKLALDRLKYLQKL